MVTSRRLIAALTAVFLCTAVVVAKEEAPLKTLRITFDVSRSMTGKNTPFASAGERVLTIDFVNNRFRDETTTTLKNSESKTAVKEISFSDGKRFYRMNALRPNEASYRDVDATRRPWQELMIPGDTHKVGQENVAGRLCDMYELELVPGQKLKSWIWNAIKLKDEMSANGFVSAMVARKIEENVAVSDTLFTLPAGTTAVSTEEAMKQAYEKRHQDAPPAPSGSSLDARVVFKSKSHPTGIAGFIYFDRDGDRRADQALRVMDNGQWSLMGQSRPGLYDQPISAGAVSSDGTLSGLPGGTFYGAKSVWRAGDIEASIGTEALPSKPGTR